ncbi:class I SAM-dependent methyltransferase [Paracoccus sp. PS-1]|uniref:class I SAM-dependent methyltransferase n=1 Tax=unclassified Paracoccus (in: a-proteobacteria) TaxID=2688777 RepID=UPI0004916DF5|nr:MULTISPECIES: class I SAM-dependent methyltransferase [unclassified Paracoccus (in: a-proteobacteria)]MDQ7261121.1 class I SAM-dependent methyltransferase [Paracoccus sp. PS1]
MDSSNGWEASAEAWIADMGETGDFSRRHVLDAPMLARIRGRGFRNALDVGCGEGRFCRMLGTEGIAATGIDPTPKLIETARSRDRAGTYLQARAEALPLPDAGFDLVVSYLTLIDIDDIRAAIAEMVRVLRPGGSLLIANLNSFSTAGGWNGDPGSGYLIDNYLEERAEWVSWRGILIRNWHRPFHAYMQVLLAQGLRLVHFDEPAPQGGEPQQVARYRRAPYLHVMEWQRDEAVRRTDPAPPAR